MAEPAVKWSLSPPIAQLVCGPLQLSVAVDDVARGLTTLIWNGTACDLAPLQIHTPLEANGPARYLADVYVRGGDLVATYERIAPATVAPQIYWRAAWHPKHSAAQVQVVLSMNTDLLDSQPHSAADTVVGAAEIHHAAGLTAEEFRPLDLAAGRLNITDGGAHVFLFRFGARNLSFAQMVHPSDFVAAELSSEAAGRIRLRSFLFHERLEKGVIRRARISGWFLPAEGDVAAAVELANRFVDEPLPLTT